VVSAFCTRDQLTFPTVVATYQLDTDASDLEKMAANIAIGQTIGTWGGAHMSELEPFMARVVSLEEIPPPQGAKFESGCSRRAIIQVAYPLKTVESDLGSLLTVLFGKLSMAGAIRLTDIEVPEAFIQHFPGPRWGVSGIRATLGVSDGPLLMSIFKPCLGLSAQTLAQMFYEQALGGVHLVKDDEILCEPDFEVTRRRLAACLESGEKARRETGQKCLYAINLTGPAELLLERARTLVADGAEALLFNYLSYGMPMLAALRQDEGIGVPLVAHPSLAGAFYGSPTHGISPKVIFGQLPRLAGADAVLFPSPYGSVSLPMPDALAVRDALSHSIHGVQSAFPVPSAGITAEMVSRMVADFGSDLIINAGTGIHDHPEGSLAGAKAFRQQIAQQPSPILQG
jgi:2,3-diketo-5-methylthiopentyl-1-phosphate enolase